MMQSKPSHAMTIGQLSQRTGVPIKTLREYERLGFLYTQGRSAGNYRLFGDEAVWCVQVTQGFRSLGLTLKEIEDLSNVYRARPGAPIDTFLDTHLAQALARVEARIADLQTVRQRIHDFQAARASNSAQPASRKLVQLLAADPRRGSAKSAS